MFENDVKMYGTQTGDYHDMQKNAFENDVKMYGTQTDYPDSRNILQCLRMM